MSVWCLESPKKYPLFKVITHDYSQNIIKGTMYAVYIDH